MWLLQIIVVIGVAFAISRVILLLRKRQISVTMGVFWIALWLAVVTVFFVPAVVGFLSNLAGVARGSDLLVYFAIMLLFYLIFRTNAKIDSTERKITELVRRQALKNEKE